MSKKRERTIVRTKFLSDQNIFGFRAQRVVSLRQFRKMLFILREGKGESINPVADKF